MQFVIAIANSVIITVNTVIRPLSQMVAVSSPPVSLTLKSAREESFVIFHFVLAADRRIHKSRNEKQNSKHYTMYSSLNVAELSESNKNVAACFVHSFVVVVLWMVVTVETLRTILID